MKMKSIIALILLALVLILIIAADPSDEQLDRLKAAWKRETSQ